MPVPAFNSWSGSGVPAPLVTSTLTPLDSTTKHYLQDSGGKRFDNTRTARRVPRMSHTSPSEHPLAVTPRSSLSPTQSLVRSAGLAKDPSADMDKDSSERYFPELPANFQSWQAKMQGQNATVSLAGRPEPVAPSSPSTMPSNVGRDSGVATIHRGFKINSPVTPQAAGMQQSGAMMHLEETTKQPLSSTSATPANIEAAMSNDVRSLSFEDAMAGSITGLSADGQQSTGIQKGQRSGLSTFASDMHTSKTRCIAEIAADHLGRASKEKGSCPMAPLVPTLGNEGRNETSTPVKKACSRCQRPMFGSHSMCLKCRQNGNQKGSTPYKENCNNDLSSASYSIDLTTPVEHSSTSTPQNLYQKCDSKDLTSEKAVGRESPNQKCLLEGSSSLHKDNRNMLVQSPFVPETPDLVYEKATNTLFVPRTGKALNIYFEEKPSKQSVPQKRSYTGSKVIDNEHCFSKKKPRVYRPVGDAVATQLPAPDVTRVLPGAGNGVPRVGGKLREVGVQTSVETVHKGTSPISPPETITERLEAKGERSRLIDAQLETSSHMTNNSTTDGSACPNGEVSLDRDRKPKSRHVREQIRDSLLDQQTHEEYRQEDESKQVEAVMACLQGSILTNGRQIGQGLRPSDEDGCKPKTHKTVSHSGMQPDDCSRNAADEWSPRDERDLMQGLRDRGVIFDEDSLSETDTGVPPPAPTVIPRDPLWQRPRWSTDLFMLAPHLDPIHSPFDVERKKKEIVARPTRKHRRLAVSYLRPERGENVHEEIRRVLPLRMVKVVPSEMCDIKDHTEEDENGIGARQVGEVEMTFDEFIGAPAHPMVILTKDKQLAYRDGTRDAKGQLPRARDKFIITNKRVACMES